MSRGKGGVHHLSLFSVNFSCTKLELRIDDHSVKPTACTSETLPKDDAVCPVPNCRASYILLPPQRQGKDVREYLSRLQPN